MAECGVQLYSVSEDLARDFDGTLQTIAEIGFTHVELFGQLRVELRHALASYGLECLSACFAKIPAAGLLESPGLSLPSRRLSLYAKSNRTPSTEAPEPARTGRMYLQHSPGMVGTAVWEQRLCGAGVVRSQQRATRITLCASHSDGEDHRLPRSRSPFHYLVAAPTEGPEHPCPTPSASSLRDSTSRSAAQFASGAFHRA